MEDIVFIDIAKEEIENINEELNLQGEKLGRIKSQIERQRKNIEMNEKFLEDLENSLKLKRFVKILIFMFLIGSFAYILVATDMLKNIGKVYRLHDIRNFTFKKNM